MKWTTALLARLFLLPHVLERVCNINESAERCDCARALRGFSLGAFVVFWGCDTFTLLAQALP